MPHVIGTLCNDANASGVRCYAGGGIAKGTVGYIDDVIKHSKGPLNKIRDYFGNASGINRYNLDVEKIPPRYFGMPEKTPKGHLDPDQSQIYDWMSEEFLTNQKNLPGYGRTIMGGTDMLNGFHPMGGMSVVHHPTAIAELTDLTSGSPGDLYVSYLSNLTSPKEYGIGKQMLNEMRGKYPGTIALQPTYKAMDFYERMGMNFDDSTGLFYLPRGMDFIKKAKGGLATKGPLNLVAPPTNHRGPFNIGMNSSNMAHKSRAAQRRGA